MASLTAGGVQLLIDSASLERRERGPIWGRVCLSVGDQFFPWTDIAVGFTVAWLHALRQLAAKQTTAESVFFMDNWANDQDVETLRGEVGAAKTLLGP